MDKLHLYVSAEDYAAMAGAAWPSYEHYLLGHTSSDPDIAQEIQQYTEMKVSSGIKFPIKTKTACQSKWTWSTIYLNQLATASCHRVDPVPFELEEFDNFHNLPKKLDDRRKMLAGQWPSGGCEYCEKIENSDGWSDRQHNLDIRGLTPPELETDAYAIHVTPRLVEIFAQNTCNLRCTYCNSNLSSAIAQENKKFGSFDHDGVKIPVIAAAVAGPAYFKKFMAWLATNIHHLRRLHLLGGETFLQHDLMSGVLEVIEHNPNPNLQLNVFSNFNVPDKNWDHYVNWIHDLQRRKHIERFDLTASIDCWGAESEYARFGLDLEKFEKRFAWAAEQDEDWLYLNVNQTITCLTMRSMPELIKKIAQYSKHRHIGHYFQFYTGPQMWQHPQTYAYDFWQDTFSEIFNEMPLATNAQREALPRMQGMQSYLKTFTAHNWAGIHKLHIYLSELDRRRGTHWQTVFPYLDFKEPTYK